MMEPMSQDAQPGHADPSQQATVVEWDGGGSDASRRLPAVPRLAAGLTRDRRLVPLATALGGVALLLSLISEWQVTVIDGTFFGDGQLDDRPFAARLADLGSLGSGYLAGVFLLVGATVLMLFGPPGVRLSARLAALSSGGVLLAVLVAVGADLTEGSRLANGLELRLLDDQLEVTYGRGLWCAVAGVTAVTLGAYLAGRHLEKVAAPVAAANTDPDADPDADPDTAADGDPVDWPWRRPGRAVRDEPDSGAPLDLTVSAATPFTPPTDGRGRPQ